MSATETLAAALDDTTVAYVVATQAAFEDLRHAASQLAGVLVLAASGAASGGPHHPALGAAAAILSVAADAVRSATPGARARRHHRHLIAAIDRLEVAVAEAAHWSDDPGLSVDAVLVPLRAAYAHLQQAGRELPGFTLLDFRQGCCAHRRRPTAAPDAGRWRGAPR